MEKFNILLRTRNYGLILLGSCVFLNITEWKYKKNISYLDGWTELKIIEIGLYNNHGKIHLKVHKEFI